MTLLLLKIEYYFDLDQYQHIRYRTFNRTIRFYIPSIKQFSLRDINKIPFKDNLAQTRQLKLNAQYELTFL